MSDRYKETYRGYLIDHHSPDPPIVTLDQLNIEEYEAFFIEANINNLMVYCKDHWGVTYYNSQVGRRHPGLTEDWVAKLKPILSKHNIEFNAYYCLEYDNEACITHPEWRVLKADGSPLTCALESAPWKMACYETTYRAYILRQLEEIVIGYQPDSLFLDIFGKSLCYCQTCRSMFEENYGYHLPETEEGLKAHHVDVVESLDHSAQRMLKDIMKLVKALDPELKVTFNFAALYNKEIRDQLDYQFTEPWAGNWLSAAYSRDTAVEQYPQLGPGDVSEVYNYQPDSIYELAAAQIVAQGCRVFMYSGSQHPDGTLENVEAEKIGKAYREIEKVEPYLTAREVVADIGIIQSDVSASFRSEGTVPASAITRVREVNGHKEALLGAMKMCDYANLTWKIIPEQIIDKEQIKSFKIIILPAVYHISTRLIQLLEGFVEQGGIVIADGQCGLYDELGCFTANYSIERLLGCKYISTNTTYKKSEWGAYLKLANIGKWHFLPNTTPPIGPVRYNVDHIEGQIESTFVNPATEINQDKWVNWWCPPPSHITEDLAINDRDFGDGKVLFMAFDFFELENKGFKLAKELLKSMLMNNIESPTIRLETKSPKTISMVAYTRESGQELIIHVLSNMAEKTNGDCPFIEAGNLIINSTDKDIKSIKCVYPNECNLEYDLEEKICTLSLPAIRIHQIIEVKFL